MDDFPGNTNREKEEKARKTQRKERTEKGEVEKVVTGEVVQRKKKFSEKFSEVFFGGDVRSTTSYVGREVLLPALKNLVVEATSQGIDRMLYGDNSRNRRDSGRPRYSYNSPFSRDPRERPNLPRQSQGGGRGRRQSVTDLDFETRADADAVLDQMGELLDRFNEVSVADLYQLAGIQSTYVDNDWGWRNLGYAEIRPTRDGYVLLLPDAEFLGR